MSRRTKWTTCFRFLIGPLILIVAILIFRVGVINLENGQEEESLDQLTNALQKAAVSCYATEGVYPPTLEYMEQHYGVLVDEDRFTVFYQVFGDNIMPDITVLPKQ